MRVSLSLRSPAALPLAGALILAACGDSKTAFDPVALSQNTDVVAVALDSNQAIQSMDALGSKMTAQAPAMGAALIVPAVSPTAATSGGFMSWAASQISAFQHGLPVLSAAAAAGWVIPDSVLATTYTYDPACNAGAGCYKPSALTGAPATGVRFMLYAVNPVNHTVTDPLTPVGCADVTDESTSASALKLHLRAYITGNACTALNTPLIDYTASATITMTGNLVTGATVNAAGSVSNGTTQVDFDLTRAFSLATGLTLDYSLSAPSAGVDVQFQGSFTFAQQGSITLTITNGGNTTVVSLTGTLASVTGTIKHNGVVVVNVSGSQSNWTFTSATGDALTDAQVAALRKVSDFTDRLLTHVNRMMGPADALLHLSFSLV